VPSSVVCLAPWHWPPHLLWRVANHAYPLRRIFPLRPAHAFVPEATRVDMLTPAGCV
jgi:hypothetical protein